MQNLTKEKVRAELQLQKIRYERQLQSAKQTDMTKLIKDNLNWQMGIKLQEQWTKQLFKQEGLNPYKSFQRKNGWKQRFKETGCQ